MMMSFRFLCGFLTSYRFLNILYLFKTSEDKGRIFVEYTIGAMVHMIYTMMKTLTNKITIEISTFSHESDVPVTKRSNEPERQSWLTLKHINKHTVQGV